MKLIPLSLTVPCLAFSSVSILSGATTVIYEEDFTNTVLPSSTQATVGFFNGNTAFDVIGVAANASVSGGALSVNTTGGFRGIGIILDPASFVGVGTYDFTFDITSFNDNGNTGSSVMANIFEGSGYDQGNNGDALRLDAQLGTLVGLGSATANEISSGVFTAAANEITLQFEYDGSSAVAIFVGVETDSFPFPTAQFDNFSVSTSAVPEPSSLLYLSVLPSFLLLRRRNRLSSK